MTPRQLEALDYVKAYIAEHRYAPTLQEIGDKMGVSKITALSYLRNLERQGFIRRQKYVSRMIDVVENPGKPMNLGVGNCPHCGKSIDVVMPAPIPATATA